MTGISTYTADDGRTLAIFVPRDFTQYHEFPPHFKTDAEKAHLADAYDVKDVETERRTKAHITDDALPLQLILLARPKGSYTAPHYHEFLEPPTSQTRHQIMICQQGSATIGVYTTTGTHIDSVALEAGDLIILMEGHSIEIAEADTTLIEIKQGPFPESEADDKVDLHVTDRS